MVVFVLCSRSGGIGGRCGISGVRCPAVCGREAGKLRCVQKRLLEYKKVFFRRFLVEKTKKNTFFKKQTREVIENAGSDLKTNPNEPKNEAGKLLKNRSCGKNEPENEPGHVVENK